MHARPQSSFAKAGPHRAGEGVIYGAPLSEVFRGSEMRQAIDLNSHSATPILPDPPGAILYLPSSLPPPLPPRFFRSPLPSGRAKINNLSLHPPPTTTTHAHAFSFFVGRPRLQRANFRDHPSSNLRRYNRTRVSLMARLASLVLVASPSPRLLPVFRFSPLFFFSFSRMEPTFCSPSLLLDQLRESSGLRGDRGEPFPTALWDRHTPAVRRGDAVPPRLLRGSQPQAR